MDAFFAVIAAGLLVLGLAVSQRLVGEGTARLLRWVSEVFSACATRVEMAYGLKCASASPRLLASRRSSSGDSVGPASPRNPPGSRSRGRKTTAASIIVLMLLVTTVLNFQLQPGDLHSSPRQWLRRSKRNAQLLKPPELHQEADPAPQELLGSGSELSALYPPPSLSSADENNLVLPSETIIEIEELSQDEELAEERVPQDTSLSGTEGSSISLINMTAFDDLTDVAFEQRVLLCLQPGDVATLQKNHFCKKGSEHVMESMWSDWSSGGSTTYEPPLPPGMTALELKALKKMMIFFPAAALSSAKALYNGVTDSITELDLEARRSLASSERDLLRERPKTRAIHLPPAAHAQHQVQPPPPAASVPKNALEKHLASMKGILDDARSFISKLRQDSMEAGTYLDRGVFVHQGNPTEAHFSDGMPDEILQNIPKDDAAAYKDLTFRTCAVVGNSGVARMTSYGADIDAHDAVFRMNQAPASNGCQIYVGGRTTIRMINARWLHKFAHGSMRHLPMEENVTVLLTRYEPNDVKRFLHQLEVTGRRDVTVRLMTQSLKARSQKLLQYYRKYMTAFKGFRDGAGESPSTGFLAINAALQICNKVTVYAFGLWKQHVRHSTERQSMYHYFHSLYGQKQVNSDAHAMDTERLLFDAMNNVGLMNMCSFRSKSGDGEGWESEEMKKYLMKQKEKEEQAKEKSHGSSTRG